MPSWINNRAVTIPSGASISAAFQLHGQSIIRVWAPSQWTPARLTFQGSQNGNVWDNLYDHADIEMSLPFTAQTSGFDRSYAIPLEWTMGCEFIRFRSGTALSPVNQDADRIIFFSFRPIA
jgi:hypothetical protein